MAPANGPPKSPLSIDEARKLCLEFEKWEKRSKNETKVVMKKRQACIENGPMEKIIQAHQTCEQLLGMK